MQAELFRAVNDFFSLLSSQGLSTRVPRFSRHSILVKLVVMTTLQRHLYRCLSCFVRSVGAQSTLCNTSLSCYSQQTYLDVPKHYRTVATLHPAAPIWTTRSCTTHGTTSRKPMNALKVLLGESVFRGSQACEPSV
jgi:hypothetical protein